MGIANELSSDVATAVLARRPDAARAETEELVEIVRDFHSAMRDLVGEERRRRLSQLPPAEPSQSAGGQAASGVH
jgi:hypothetical protein